MKYLTLACAIAGTSQASSKFGDCGNVTVTYYTDSDCATEDEDMTKTHSIDKFNINCERDDAN